MNKQARIFAWFVVMVTLFRAVWDSLKNYLEAERAMKIVNAVAGTPSKAVWDAAKAIIKNNET